MEAALPSCAEARLAVAKVSQIDDAIRYLLGEAQEEYEASIHYKEIVTGSRAEGFTLEDGWGIEKADVDSMYIYGGAWTVHVPCPSTQTPVQPYLELDLTGCDPAYGRVRIVGKKDVLAERMSNNVGRGKLRYPTVLFGAVMLGVVFYFVFSNETVSASTGITGLIALLSMPAHIRSGYYRREDGYRLLEVFRRNLPRVYSVLMFWSIPSDSIYLCFWPLPPDSPDSQQYYLSSEEIITALGDFGHAQNKEGPSQTIAGDDYVPGLLCNGRFKNMDDFLHRSRGSWPKRDTLDKIACLWGLLVPTGKKGSDFRYYEWRYSYSLPEILIARDMPPWVKIAYRTVKYTLKSLKLKTIADQDDESELPNFNMKTPLLWASEKIADHLFNSLLHLPDELQYAAVGGRSKISSYHIKTVLMWELEQNYGDHNECPFELVQSILHRLYDCLNKGKLKNYFNCDCNLLEGVAPEEVALTKENIKKILKDPLKFILFCPLNPREVYGETNPDDLSYFLNELLLIKQGEQFLKCANKLSLILRKLDTFRNEKYQAMCDKGKTNDIQRAVYPKDRAPLLKLDELLTELIESK